MITRREILATINVTTRETGYERVLAGDLLSATQTDNIDAPDAALLDLAGVALTGVPLNGLESSGGILGRVRAC